MKSLYQSLSNRIVTVNHYVDLCRIKLSKNIISNWYITYNYHHNKTYRISKIYISTVSLSLSLSLLFIIIIYYSIHTYFANAITSISSRDLGISLLHFETYTHIHILKWSRQINDMKLYRITNKFISETVQVRLLWMQ